MFRTGLFNIESAGSSKIPHILKETIKCRGNNDEIMTHTRREAIAIVPQTDRWQVPHSRSSFTSTSRTVGEKFITHRELSQ